MTRGAERADRLLYAVFACSGAAALVFEVSWSRQVGLVLGNTADSVAVVLAAYFAGLAVGQTLGSRIARRVSPLVGYSLCELLAAAWGLGLPSVLAAWDAPAEARAAWCFAVLLPATAPLGATFPLLAGHLSRRTPGGGRRVALAYAANTVGGVVGVLAASAGGLVVVGVTASSYLAAGVCAGCGATALALARRGGVAAVPAAASSGGAGWWVGLAALSGLATLGLEVLYARMFALVLHNSTTSFGVVLATFLAGLALGAAAAAALGRRVGPARLAVAAAGLGAVAVLTSVVLFVRLTGLNDFEAGDTPAGYFAGVLALAVAVVLPPVVLLGMVLPAAFAGAGGALGRVVAANTLAAAVGSVAAGYLWLPALGLWWAFSVPAALLALPAVAALVARGRVVAGGGLAALVAAAVMLVGASPRQPTGDEAARGEEIIRRWETPYGWIDVVRSRADGSFRVRENLHYRHGSTGANAAREYRQGRLPLLLHPAPREVAFLGLGTGLTAAPVVADCGVERAVVVELIPAVVEAARLLGDANRGVVDHPKVEVRVDDARHYLRRTDRRFDVVVSDLFVPWESRAGYLYTIEHAAAVRRCLRPGGLFCQWVALYQVGPDEFELIADTLAAVFPTVTVWWGQFDARYGMVALVGSDAPLVLDPDRLAARFDAAGDPPGGADPELAAPASLPDLYAGDWPARPGRRLNTDEHPWLEFTAPLSQRTARTLTGPRLRAYFDAVLGVLPADGVRFDGPLAGLAGPTRRREAQRLGLTGR
ncbi:fused MFS/spermidine synthase [Urbifossiella limnaea]|uniref:Spermidine synthase n=1 Tax=Urbifossiella limnaea TaxID=2528023 RepID=A0A517XV03_9BACT|nr:fused MFS/spermidine synthase [Urbifossiella limnaea]QDU21351.1 Spermidine synthase [Urbifossiella limnaea]